MTVAPIVLFVYNRPWHTQKTVEALQKNDLASESDLYIFADGPKKDATEEQKEKIRQVREYIHNISGFKSITICEKDSNNGLANSVITGVTEIINKFGKVIVVEDDIVTSRYFLKVMNEALDFFEKDEKIFSVSGYNYPTKTMKIPNSYKNNIYLSYRHGSWGWGTWKNRWESVDWEVVDFKEFCENIELQKTFNRGGADMSGMLKAQMEGKIDSWAIRFDYSLFKNNCFCVRPIKSLVINIGFDNSGTHTGENPKWITILDNSWNPKIATVEPNKTILKNFRHVFDPPPKPPKYSLKRFIGKVFKRIFK